MIGRMMIALILSSLVMNAQKIFVPTDEPYREGTLDLIFVTASGERIPPETDILIEQLVKGKTIAKWTATETLKLKYGTYRLRFQYPGAYAVEKTVNIKGPYQTLSICFFVAPIELPWEGNLVRGRISDHSRENDCRWVRFICPFADSEIRETKASATGDFALDDVRPGKYLVFTIGHHGICESSDVTILFGKPVYDLSIVWTAFSK